MIYMVYVYRQTHPFLLRNCFLTGITNERYLKQCLFNLQEKYDCGGISEKEWKIIENKFGQYLKLNAELEKEVEELREYKWRNQPLYVDPMSL